MGKRKRLAAEERKEIKKTLGFAKLNNCPTSPRKMRLLTDLIRGKKVDLALNILKLSNKEAAPRLYKLLLSAVSNWQSKHEGIRLEDAELVVDQVFVDGGTFMKRLRTAPQGRGYRIRKRSNHVTIMLNSSVQTVEDEKVENVELNSNQ